ncbi:MAG: heme-binding protein, partial [Proteobacteria bacterium]|nr:heme-binding protein [Pseudomonadota bacterium]
MDDIDSMGAAATAEALAHDWKVTIAICDEGGHLMWLRRLEGAAPISSYIA